MNQQHGSASLQTTSTSSPSRRSDVPAVSAAMTGPLRSHHNVVVVGPQCAAASPAMPLARAGHDVWSRKNLSERTMFTPVQLLDPVRMVYGARNDRYDCPDVAALDRHIGDLRRRITSIGEETPTSPMTIAPTSTGCSIIDSGSPFRWPPAELEQPADRPPCPLRSARHRRERWHISACSFVTHPIDDPTRPREVAVQQPRQSSPLAYSQHAVQFLPDSTEAEPLGAPHWAADDS